MSDQNIALIRDMWDAYNARDLDRFGEVFDWDAPFIFNAMVVQGESASRAMNEAAFAGSSDHHASPELFVADGDLVAFRVRYTGTQDGPGFDGSPATGKPFDFHGNYIARIVDGRISGWWAVVDVARTGRP